MGLPSKKMLATPTKELREELLALKGVGPETADSILLYGGNHEVFVVDAYTRRILERHSVLPANAHYEEIRSLFEGALAPLSDSQEFSLQTMTANKSWKPAHSPSGLSTVPRSQTAQIFNEMHALIVTVGKSYCRKSEPLCSECPLGKFLKN
jgi:endonuclease-3 related protein